MALAILNSQGQVVTFVREDSLAVENPPEECTAVDESKLPTDWLANASDEYKAQHP